MLNPVSLSMSCGPFQQPTEHPPSSIYDSFVICSDGYVEVEAPRDFPERKPKDDDDDER